MQRTPLWYEDIVQKNGTAIMIFLFLILPQILASFMISGAFEVMLDGTELVFSKIATGRMPRSEEFIAPLTKAGLKYALES